MIYLMQFSVSCAWGSFCYLGSVDLYLSSSLKSWYLFLQISLFSVYSSPSGTIIAYILDHQVSQICPVISVLFFPCGVFGWFLSLHVSIQQFAHILHTLILLMYSYSQIFKFLPLEVLITLKSLLSYHIFPLAS